MGKLPRMTQGEFSGNQFLLINLCRSTFSGIPPAGRRVLLASENASQKKSDISIDVLCTLCSKERSSGSRIEQTKNHHSRVLVNPLSQLLTKNRV